MATQVSVIMNCLNCEQYVKEAIDSVYAQTYPNWEIIFWDNASTDNSAAIARRYAERLRYFRGEQTIPLGAARNKAIEQAQGVLLAFLDCDDLWLPEKLEKQMPFFRNADVGLVYSDVIYFNARGYAKPKYGKHTPPQGKVFEAILFNNFTCLSTVVIRSDVIKQFDNWFDPTFTVIEDTDLFMRIARKWEFAYAPFILGKYRMHEKSMSSVASQLFRQEEEQLVEKCKRIYPDFGAEEERKYKTRIKRDRAVNEWKVGHNARARKLMQPLALQSWNYLLTYSAMFLPYKLIHHLRVVFSRQAFLNYV